MDPTPLFDWKRPDYPTVFRRRAAVLREMRADAALVRQLRMFYRDNPAQFIVDWGVTINPKNVELGLPSVIPFVLYPRQYDWVNWVVDHWQTQRPGLTEKTRQMGFSWLSMATACTLCLFHDGMSVGVGSRKQEYVDVLGDPKSLLQKGREFLRYLPEEFTGGWSIKEHAPHMRLMFPGTGAIITGESGDNIGRGNTTGIYFVDEAAFLERPSLIDASLSQTTNCRIDISTPNGSVNPFAQKRFSGKIDVFSFHWRDDPSKDQAWYEKQVSELDSVTVAQELDVDYSASVEGIVIPSAWVQASIDAHVKLGIEPTGARLASLDVADEGRDKNALCGAYGILLECIEEWSGVGGDIFATVVKAFDLCEEHGYTQLKYDADGLGAGCRGDARIINEKRNADGRKIYPVEAFRGSEAPFNPEGEDVKGRKNKDFFANRKAQAWWGLRTRFQKTFRAVAEGQPFDPDEIISIASSLPLRAKLVVELSQPTYGLNSVGKILIDKAPDGAKSPNLADAAMIRFSTVARPPMRISAAALVQI